MENCALLNSDYEVVEKLKKLMKLQKLIRLINEIMEVNKVKKQSLVKPKMKRTVKRRW